MARQDKGRKWAGLCAAVMTTLVVVVHVAPGWACVPQPLITLQPVASGPAGSQVTVKGLAFGQGPVEIRWNAVDGPLLAQGMGPTISGAITVPQGPDGLYSVIAFNRGADGTIGSSARASFQVAAAGAPARAPLPTPTTRSSPHSGGGNVASTIFTGLGALVVGLIAGAAIAWRRNPQAKAEP